MKSTLQRLARSIFAALGPEWAAFGDVAASLIGLIDLPDGDSRWADVLEAFRGLVDKMRDAQALDRTARDKARAVGQREFHRFLASQNLIKEA